MTQFASANRRILALWFAWLETDRLTRIAPRSAPLVVAAKIGGALKIHASDGKAEALGLVRGMALTDARAMVPDLAVAMADEVADRQLLERIAAWCDRFTPFVGIVPPQILLLDITGVDHLFGGEKALRDMLRAALHKQGFRIRCAIAGTAAAACTLARGHDGAIAEPGQDAALVAPLPVDALALDPATTHAFRRAGLKTIRQVAARPRAELVARFGEETVTRIDGALGKAGSPISPRQPLPDFMAEHRFADPVTGADIISSTLQTLADRLVNLLRERGQGARAFEAVFFRTDGIVRRLVIEAGRPLRDAAMVRRLFGEKLDALADPLDPGFGFDLIRLCVPRAEPVTPETVGLDSKTHSDEEIDFLIDRLATRFGAGRILRYLPNDTHIPEAAAIATPAQAWSPQEMAWEPIRQSGEAPRRPLRLLARPEPVEAVAEIPDGPPLRFRWRQVLHDVVFAEGPERIAMEWWHRQGLTRDYFRVENAHGRRFWLYRDGLYERETDLPKWFVHGVFA